MIDPKVNPALIRLHFVGEQVELFWRESDPNNWLRLRGHLEDADESFIVLLGVTEIDPDDLKAPIPLAAVMLLHVRDVSRIWILEEKQPSQE